MISENSEENDSSNYERYITQYKEKLEKDIQFFKKDTFQIKAGTYKKVKSKHLSQYIKSNDKQLIITSYPLTWSNNKFSSTFLDVMESFDYNTLIDIIIPILSGNFTSCNLDKVYEKKISFFFSKKYDNNMTILFAIYFKRSSSDSTKVTQVLEFYNFLNANSSHSRNAFISNKFCNDMKKYKYPCVEYDRTGLFHRQNMFYLYKTKIGDVDIYNPYDDIEIINENYLYKTIINGKSIEVLNDPNKFKHNEKTEQTINYAIKNKHEQIVTNLILDNKWQGVFSEQEKTLIQMVSPFMLSGQPGTGKTTVILVKILADLLDSEIKRSLLFMHKIDYDFIKMNYNLNDFSNKIRFVFTSFSQELCDKVQNLFEKMLESTNNFVNLNYKGLSRDGISMLPSFDLIQQFPVFLNFRKLMFMIDSSITFQFFARTSFKYSGLTDCQIAYNANQLYICNNYSSDMNPYNLQKANFFLRNPIFAGSLIEMHEVNENYFFDFYNSLLEQSAWKTKKDKFVKPKKSKNKNNKDKNSGNNSKKNEDSYVELEKKVLENCQQYNSQISPSEIYSQIHSVIKGSLDSSNYETNCISRENYISKGKKLTMIDDVNILNHIYDVSLLYEKQKKEKHLFDIQDITNHLIRRVKIELIPKQIKLIDFLYIDEIQDLTINQIYLLALVSKQIKVFAGDTSQTISEVNRFRFKDLKQLFYIFSKTIVGFSPVEEALLNLNFRLNCNVLKLSTFVNHLIQKLFPLTVDKFKEDVSLKIIPYKPILLSNLNEIESLITTKSTIKAFISESMTFSYNTCWLFHSTQTMERIKTKYSRQRNRNEILNEGMQSEIDGMTVQECKGLEYEIVLVYNFFTDSKFRNVWYQIIQNVESQPNDNIQHGLDDLRNRLNFENFTSVIKQVRQLYPELLGKIDENFTKSYETNKKKIIDFIISSYQNLNLPVLKNFFYFDVHKHFAFCTELKQFYVIITRPRTFLLFYEELNCKYIYNFFIKERLIINDHGNESKLKIQIWDYFQKANLKINDEQDFYVKAESEFKDKNYARASFLFKKIGAYEKARLADIYLTYEALQNMINQQNFDEQNMKTNLERLLANINMCEEDFEDKYKIKGFCYQHQKKYDDAIKEYEKAQLYKLCGDICYFNKQQYKKAFEYFKIVNDYSFCFLSLEKINQQTKYKDLIDYVDEIKLTIGLLEYNERYKKYYYPYWDIYLTKSQKTLIINPKDLISDNKQRIIPESEPVLNELTSNGLTNWKRLLMNNIKPNRINTKIKKETKIDSQTAISTHILNFFNRYYDGLNAIQRYEKEKQLLQSNNNIPKNNTTQKNEGEKQSVQSNNNTTGNEEYIKKLIDQVYIDFPPVRLAKNDPKIKEALINFNCPKDLISYVNTYYYNLYYDIMTECLFKTPVLYYFRMNTVKINDYINKLFDFHCQNQNIVALPTFQDEIEESIQKIGNNMLLENKDIKNIIFELKAFHHFFLDNFYTYSKPTQIAIDCYLSRKNQINLYFIDILEKLQKNPISLPGEKVKSMPMYNTMDQNKLNKQTIVDSYDILVMSSFIRVNIISILKQKYNKYNNCFKCLFPELHKTCLNLDQKTYPICTDIQDKITKFISSIEKIINNPDQPLTYSIVEYILDLGSILSMFFFICHTKQNVVFYKYSTKNGYESWKEYKFTFQYMTLINLVKQLFFLLRNIMVNSTIENSSRLEEIQLLVFSLFHAYGILYVSKSKKIQELKLLKNINACIIDKNSPMFSYKLIFTEYFQKKGNIGFFDSYGYGLIIKSNLVLEIFVNSIFKTFSYYICRYKHLTQNKFKRYLFSGGENCLASFLIIYIFQQFYYSLKSTQHSVFQDFFDFMKLKQRTSFYKFDTKAIHNILLNKNKNDTNILFHTLFISLMIDSVLCYNNQTLDFMRNSFMILISELKSYASIYNQANIYFIRLFEIVLKELIICLSETNNDTIKNYLRMIDILQNNLETIPRTLVLLCLKMLNNFFCQFLVQYCQCQKFFVYDYYLYFPITKIHFDNCNEKNLLEKYYQFFQILIDFMDELYKTKDRLLLQFYELNYYCFFLSWLNALSCFQDNQWEINDPIFSFFEFLEIYSLSNRYYEGLQGIFSKPEIRKEDFFIDNKFKIIDQDIFGQLRTERFFNSFRFRVDVEIDLFVRKIPNVNKDKFEFNISTFTCDKKIQQNKWFFKKTVENKTTIEKFFFEEHHLFEEYLPIYLTIIDEYRAVCPKYYDLNEDQTRSKKFIEEQKQKEEEEKAREEEQQEEEEEIEEEDEQQQQEEGEEEEEEEREEEEDVQEREEEEYEDQEEERQ